MLQSERLLWLPFDAQMLRDILYRREALGHILNLHVPEDWPGEDFAEILPMMLADMERDARHAGWDGMIVLKEPRIAIGGMGLKGGPDAAGTVDLGYNVLPVYQNQGYATEMARALIAWAFSQREIACVTADCLVDNGASIRVLEKAGLRRNGSRDNLLLWKLNKAEWLADSQR